MRGFEKPPWWAAVVIVAGLVWLAVGWPLASHRGGEPLSQAQLAHLSAAASAAAASDVAARPKTVAFLGDSYTGGSAMGGTDDTGWPAIVCRDLGWQEAGGQLFAVGGTGYVNPGPNPGQDQTFGTRVDAVIAAKPDIVIVAGGINDAQYYSTAQIRAAALDVLTRLGAGLPAARIVVVGPFYPRAYPQADLNARDAIFSDAAALGIKDTIDPQPWFTGPDAIEIGSDGTHPTDRGHEQLAHHMEQALKALGLPTSPVTR